MRAAEPPGNYKKFLGSSFLSGECEHRMLLRLGGVWYLQLQQLFRLVTAVGFCSPCCCLHIPPSQLCIIETDCVRLWVADFTLIICSESAIEKQQDPALFAAQDSSSPAGEPQPGTPDKSHSPKAAAAPGSLSVLSASAHASTVQDSPAAFNGNPAAIPEVSTLGTLSTDAGDAPCSGQDHTGDHADILPQR